MPTLLAVSLSKDSVSFAVVQCQREGRPSLESLLEVRRSEFSHVVSESDGETGTPASVIVPDEVREFITKEKFSDVVCLFEPPRFFSELLTFPFDSASKVEQVAPLELEEALPFEIEDYVIAPVILERNLLEVPTSQREFLVVGVEGDTIGAELEFLKCIGLDPVLFVPKISVLSSITKFLPPEEVQNGVGLITIDQNRLLFSLTRDAQPILQRGIAAGSENKALAEVLPTVLSASRILVPSRLYFVGVPFELDIDGISSKSISFADLEFETGDFNPTPSLDNLGMVALAAIRVKKLPIANFRKGNFSYRGNLKSYFEPFIEDKSYVLTLLGALVLWIAIITYSSSSEMAALNSKAKELISTTFPGQSVATGTELSFVNEKLQNLESTMKGLGNISSLSPLDALRELSEVIPTGIDVAIDSLSTTQLGMQFGGSVGDMGSVGKLIGALEKREKFCEVRVDPRGALPGGVRVRIVGELKYCP